jgi:predicted dienelactone hydrolase
MAVFYPTSVPATTVKMEIFELEIATDAAPKEGTFSLVLISHGSGGSPLLYRTLALYLARNGFVVGMPKHPFNNWRDNSLEGQADNLANRPRHIQRAIDWFFDERHAFTLEENFASIGHSMGGCTALTMAGGVPTSKETTGQMRKIEVEHDSRLKALVLLAPATTWFGAEGALSKVDAPILMYIGDRDERTPYNPHARVVLDGLPDKTKILCKIVEKAGHFSFLSPFPKRMVREFYPASQDLPGFDRLRFLDELNAEVLDFLSRNLEVSSLWNTETTGHGA